jgi:hypothetical protein
MVMIASAIMQSEIGRVAHFAACVFVQSEKQAPRQMR